MKISSLAKSLVHADFITSTGLYIGSEQAVMVRMRKDLFRVSLVGQAVRDIPHSTNDSQRQKSLVTTIRLLLRDFEASQGPLHVCLSSSHTVACEVTLPQAVGENLRQVVGYEIERLAPFRREELYYDYLTMSKKGDRIRLFVFAVPRKVLDGILGTLLDLGIRPAAVETTTTAVANYVMFSTEGLTGQGLVLASQDSQLEVVGLAVRPSILTRETEILYSYSLPQVDWARGLSLELLESIGRDATRAFVSKAVDDLLLSTTRGSIPAEDLSEIASPRLALTKPVQSSWIPAIGSALRGLREGTFELNLQPEGSAQVPTKSMSRLNVLLAGFLGLGLLVLAASHSIRDEVRLIQIRRELRKIEPVVEKLSVQEEKLNKVRAEVSVLAATKSARGEILQLLGELSKVIPASAYLTLLRYQNESIELRGSAENASGLVPLLEASPLIKSVGFNAPTTRRPDNRESFSIKAEIE